MANPSPTTHKPSPGGKTMSSRLLTMKFMQRASASASASNQSVSGQPSTPGSVSRNGSISGSAMNSPITSGVSGSNSDADRNKRVKTSYFSGSSGGGGGEMVSPALLGGNGNGYAGGIASSVDGEAVSEWGQNGAETKWRFAVRETDIGQDRNGGEVFRVDIMQGRRFDDEDDQNYGNRRTEEGQGRQVFGKKRKAKANIEQYDAQEDIIAKKEEAKDSPDDENESDGSNDSSGTDDSEESLDRQARKILDAPEYGRSSLTGGLSGRAPRQNSNIQCHSCQGFGHISRECPNKRRSTYDHHQTPARRNGF